MVDRLDAEFKFGQEALNLRSYRQQVLSSNIANANTPGYQARDVNFSSALKTALAKGGHDETGSDGGLVLATADARQIIAHSPSTSGGADAAYGRLLYQVPTQSSLDGNSVDLDTQRVQFADNALHYETGLNIMTQQIKTMLTAITSQGS
jgi:flagellar basal-body rod protein FlgB